MTAISELPAKPIPHRRRFPIRAAMETLLPLLALFLLVAATAACEKELRGTSNFLKLENILNILRQLAPIGVVALGMTFAIISGGIDLSVGSLVALAGGAGIWAMNLVINAQGVLSDMADARQFHSDLPYTAFTESLARHAMQWGWAGNEIKGVWIGVGVALLVALLAGLVNGLLIAKGKIAPFIATIGGFAAYRSIALAMADGGEFRSASNHLYAQLGTGGVTIPFLHVRPGVAAVLPYSVIVFFALAFLAAILLNKTRYGRHVLAIGSNERSAIYSAINVSRVKILTYILVGLSCGIAALLIGSRLNSISSSQTGNLYELDAIAAVVIGGTRMSGGSGTIFGTVIGVLILGVIGNMLSFLDVSPYLQGLVKGAIIVIAVLIQRIGKRTT
jgi:ribose transport system permease protein